jgi:hypothetical protein
MHKKLWLQSHFEDPATDTRIILKWMLEKQGGRVWFRIETSGRFL